MEEGAAVPSAMETCHNGSMDFEAGSVGPAGPRENGGLG